MAQRKTQTGLIVSTTSHVVLLALALVSFAASEKFSDAVEAIPVEMMSDQSFNQISKGESAALRPMPTQRAEKQSQITELKPHPPQEEARVDIPPPPSPLRRLPDPGEQAERIPEPPPVVQPPPPPFAQTPDTPQPVRSEAAPEQPQESAAPEKAAPEKADVEEKPVPNETAEPVAPPKPIKAVAPKPQTRPAPKPEQAKSVQPKPAPKPAETPPQLKPQDVAALLNAKARESETAGARPKSGQENPESTSIFNVSAIARLLGRDKPQQTASTGQEVVRTASLGVARGAGQKMSPNVAAAFDSWIMERYMQCFRYSGGAKYSGYLPEVSVVYAPDGALAGAPRLLNPTQDPALTSLAAAALAAVRACNPLRVPAQFQPFYEQWKARRIRFDPSEMG